MPDRYSLTRRTFVGGAASAVLLNSRKADAFLPFLVGFFVRRLVVKSISRYATRAVIRPVVKSAQRKAHKIIGNKKNRSPEVEFSGRLIEKASAELLESTINSALDKGFAAMSAEPAHNEVNALSAAFPNQYGANVVSTGSVFAIAKLANELSQTDNIDTPIITSICYPLISLRYDDLEYGEIETGAGKLIIRKYRRVRRGLLLKTDISFQPHGSRSASISRTYQV